MPKTITVKNLTGGLSLREPELLENNQFETLTNFYYNQDKRLETRRGYTTYFDTLPDTVVTFEECNATTNFAVSGDADTLATGTAIRGSNSVSFNITVSATKAALTGSVAPVDISNTKGYIGFWYKVPTGFTGANFTNVKVRLGTDASNYYEWTLTATDLGENANTYLKLSFDDATETGTVADTSIAIFAFEVNYAAGYSNQSGILVDAIRVYSSTSTTPVTSYFFNKDESNDSKITIAVAGANMFHWNETGWDLIDSGLTEYETAEGKTSHRTRWGFFAYKLAGGVSVGMCDGVNAYRVWNGTTMTNYGSQPKYRYFLVLFDRVFAAGVDAAPFTLYYTNAAIVSLAALDGNDVDVGNEFDGRINGLFPLAEQVLVGKTEKIYYVDVDNQIAKPLDNQNGLFSHRVTKNVGNAVMYQTKNGIDNLSQKGAATGSQAIQAEAYSSDLQELISKITANQFNANCSGYIKELNNLYFTFDTGDDNIPDTTLVYSSLVGKTWTQYTYPAAYDYGYYIDSANSYIYLLCSANSGQIFRIENGFDDNGASIQYEFLTKRWDFDKPSTYKDWQSVDIYGLKNVGSAVDIDVIVDGNTVYTATIDDRYIDVISTAATVGSDPIADVAVGGGSSSEDSLDLYRYRIRLGGSLFAGGSTLQVRGYTEDNPTVFTLERMQFTYDDNTFDIFPLSNTA